MIEHGAEKYEEYETHIIFPTICHNPYGAHMNMKLYYYKDSHLFCIIQNHQNNCVHGNISP